MQSRRTARYAARNESSRPDRTATTYSLVKASAVVYTARWRGCFSRKRPAMPCNRCVLPSPHAPWMNSGLNERGQSLVDAAYRALGYTTDAPGVWVKA